MAIEIDATAIAGAIGAVSGALATALTLAGRVRRALAQLHGWIERGEQFWSDWAGVDDRPGVPGRPGVMVRLAGMEARQSMVDRELRTNGGSSLRDAIRATQTDVAEIRAQVEQATVIALRPAERATGAILEKRGESA